MRLEVKYTTLFNNTFVETNNEYIFHLYQISKNISDGSIVEDIRFLSCVIFGFVNKGKKNGSGKYNEILARLRRYSIEKGTQKELALESYTCVCELLKPTFH
jgi:site-specific DNA-adenine methylase